MCPAHDNASRMRFPSRVHVFHTDPEDACPFLYSDLTVLCWYLIIFPKDISQSNFLSIHPAFIKIWHFQLHLNSSHIFITQQLRISLRTTAFYSAHINCRKEIQTPPKVAHNAPQSKERAKTSVTFTKLHKFFNDIHHVCLSVRQAVHLSACNK